MPNKINITKLYDNRGEITKKFSLKDGKLIKEAKTTVYDGRFESDSFTFEGFTDHLNTMPSNQALILGKCIHRNEGKIVAGKEAEDISSGIYKRNLQNFDWHEDMQLVYLDFDDGKNTPEEAIDIVEEILPGFKDVTKIVKYSSSAFIYKESTLLSTLNTFHIFYFVNHPERIKEIFSGKDSLLAKMFWLKGYGYIKNSKPKDVRKTVPNQLVRVPYDYSVFSPERLVIEAGPVLTDGLRRERIDARIIYGTCEYLDLSQYEPLSDEQELEYNVLVNQAKAISNQTPYMVESKNAFIDFHRKGYEDGSLTMRKEFRHLSPKEAADGEFKLSKEFIILPPDHEIYLIVSGETITVAQILAEPEKYHELECRDPHEPDYSTSAIAKIYSNQDVPVIHSFAHGGIIYNLIPGRTKEQPDFRSTDYVIENFYYVAHNGKNEIIHIVGNQIEKYSFSGFKNRLAGFYVYPPSQGQNVKKISTAKWWMNNPDKKCIADDGFAPGKPLIYESHQGLVFNGYMPDILRKGLEIPTVESQYVAAELFLNHIRKLVYSPDEAEVVIDFLSYLVQYPQERPMFSVMIISETRGVGKDMIVDIFSKMMGQYCKKATIESLSRSDAWGDPFYQSKLVTVSECGASHEWYTVCDNLKNVITANSLQMNLKHSKTGVSGIISFHPVILFNISKLRHSFL